MYTVYGFVYGYEYVYVYVYTVLVYIWICTVYMPWIWIWIYVCIPRICVLSRVFSCFFYLTNRIGEEEQKSVNLFEFMLPNKCVPLMYVPHGLTHLAAKEPRWHQGGTKTEPRWNQDGTKMAAI